MIKIFIADDHALIREGLKNILQEQSDISIVGESRTASETIDRVAKSECDILVLDLGLPDRPGLDVLKEVKRARPHLCVLVLSMLPEESFALRTLKAGADGYLSKDSAATELVVALRRIAGGRKYLSPEISQNLLQKLRGDESTLPHDLLSDREFQILRLIGAGVSTTQIAEELNLSASTVNTHRAHILEKMQMSTNAELMRYVIENKLD
jgi:DNA-binding NarL/FixJ family response regulator